MPTAWIVTQTNPQLAEVFQNAGWETEVFAPGDVVPASQSRVRDPDVIVFEVAEGALFDRFQELCRDKLAPVLAIVPNWAWADRVGEAGADEVMVAPVNPVELLWRARRLVRAAKIVRVGELMIDLSVQKASLRDCWIELTPVEFRLLACLAEHVGQAVSRDIVLRDTWGYFPERGGTPEQVKSGVKRLRQKIEPDPHHPQYIISIRRVGYQLRSQAQWEAAMRNSQVAKLPL